ncbi:alpha/beta hydrolase [Cellulomonas massiliensis]|uniref:alpha/beta hydrolase n=1 Tax=Cellulomonas massiliensis TaxID=1465811 RepID=UPI0002E59AC6|nr:alpha/beta hydrolase [Cellulomonas massiliensis]
MSLTSTVPGATPSSATTVTWREPAGISPRGTVVLLVGRGETAEVYERLGRRLAADAYRVVALGTDDPPLEEVTALLADAELPGPHVLLGSDSGASLAVAVAREEPAGLDALVLAGLPTGPAGRPLDREAELDARSACPNHRAVLLRSTRSSLFDAFPTVLVDVAGPALAVPVLALHGGADPISPSEDAVAAYRRLGATQVSVVEGGRHDVLNDVTHRSVAATVVLFLERLRLAVAGTAVLPVLPEIVVERT